MSQSLSGEYRQPLSPGVMSQAFILSVTLSSKEFLSDVICFMLLGLLLINLATHQQEKKVYKWIF